MPRELSALRDVMHLFKTSPNAQITSQRMSSLPERVGQIALICFRALPKARKDKPAAAI